jgi:lipopolysaccharide transport system ATP-binding protein
MYVRLGFAVAAHLEPEILIVDEVLAVGDLAFQRKSLRKMKDVANSGRTILFVSHNMDTVSTICERTIWLENGLLRAAGPTREIVSEYISSALNVREQSFDHLRYRHAGFGKRARFENIKLDREDGAILQFGETLKFMLETRANEELGELCIGASIFDISGSCVGTLITRETFSMKRNEVATLRLIVPNLNLAPGIYYAGFSIAHFDRDNFLHTFDTIIGTPFFKIIPNTRGDDGVANWEAGWGSIVMSNVELEVKELRRAPSQPCVI